MFQRQLYFSFLSETQVLPIALLIRQMRLIMFSIASQHPAMQGQALIKTYFWKLLEESEKSQYNPFSKEEERCLSHSLYIFTTQLNKQTVRD